MSSSSFSSPKPAPGAAAKPVVPAQQRASSRASILSPSRPIFSPQKSLLSPPVNRVVAATRPGAGSGMSSVFASPVPQPPAANPGEVGEELVSISARPPEVKTQIKKASSAENISGVIFAARVRPESEAEKKEEKSKVIVRGDREGKAIVVEPPSSLEREASYTVDYAFGSETSQKEIYETIGVELLKTVLQGFSGVLCL
jgi:Kinesin motor domain